MAERLIYEDRHVRITTARAVFGTKTYALSNIVAVDLRAYRPYASTGTWLVLLGACLALVQYLNPPWRTSTDWLIAALALAVGGFALALIKLYRVLFHTTRAAEITVLRSARRAYVVHLVAALNQAIAERG